jgi:hypothetical protein|tara:strand:+ start:90 stop:404 length:315 start_codon:yes stop_codon:yes gene_type:complete
MSDEEYTLKSSIENAVWNLREQEENNCLLLFTDEKVNYQPWFYDLGEPNPETRLNGRLMAMSPQMLKLLFEARAALRTVDPELVEDITSIIDYIDPECLPIKGL